MSTTFEPSHTPIEMSKYQRAYERGRIEIFEAMIPDGQGQKALDLGCGPGRFTSLLASRGWAVTAVDTDSENIEQAARFGEARLGDAISVVQSLADGAYGLVLALELIEHMPESHAAELLSQIARVLQPNGMIILSTPNRHSPEGLGGYYWGERVRGWGKWNAWDPTHVHIYTSSEVIRLVRRSGFKISSVTGYWYEGYRLRLPWKRSSTFPMNRFGFNVILSAKLARSTGVDARDGRGRV